MRRKRRGGLFLAVGVLLLAASLVLAGYNVWDGRRAAEASGSAMEALSSVIPTGDRRDIGQEQYIPDYILDSEMDPPTVEVDGQNYIGYVEIPALELSLPVLESWSYPNLKLGPCRYAGSPYQDDMVIAAHNFPEHFGRLQDVELGDEVRFTDTDGNVFRYSVVEMLQLAPRPSKAMLEGDWDLSLFTCTLSGQYRTTVRCVRAEENSALQEEFLNS